MPIRCWELPIAWVPGGRWIPYSAAQVIARRAARIVCVGTGVGFLASPVLPPAMPPVAFAPPVEVGALPPVEVAGPVWGGLGAIGGFGAPSYPGFLNAGPGVAPGAVGLPPGSHRPAVAPNLGPVVPVACCSPVVPVNFAPVTPFGSPQSPSGFGSGSPTPVDAPAMLAVFGLAVAGLIGLRRRG